ncbi:MAG TPA: 3-dehydroquinate synthase [Bacteroidales bacterium]|nr:3-dehydroquinate synthase [Bacteroidales bacterium]
MKLLEVKAESNISKILIGESMENLPNYLKGRKTIILTDTYVAGLYRKRFPSKVPVIEMGLGETNKTLLTLEKIYDKLIDYEADRTTFLLAIGGGIVCDVAGFVASTFMRGMPFGFVSTTLLSQVDASVGGKNGVNFQGYKNMIGVFSQPEFVLCDTGMLKTLDEKQFKAGFSEIIKAGVIKSAELFAYCENNANSALMHDSSTLIKMIYDSVEVKAKVVEADERERGERRLLNLGHTFGHAIEKLTGILHGQTVSIGMVLAAKVSEKLGLISSADTDRIRNVLLQYDLPVVPNTDIALLFNAMKKDKKREGEEIHLVLLEGIGEAVTKKIPYSQLEQLIDDLRSDFR